MNLEKNYEPVPWASVFLAIIPGVLLALSRRNVDEFGRLLGIIGWLYLAILAVGLPVIWYRTKHFPVWGLLPAGALAWFGLYLLATGLTWLTGPGGHPLLSLEVANTLLQAAVAIALFLILLRHRRVPIAVWGLMALLFALNLIVIYLTTYQTGRLDAGNPLQLLTILSGPIEGVMLLALGLLAVPQHSVLSLLVVLGGYLYMLSDSDYLYGFSLRDWPGLTIYLIGMVALYAVVAPVAFMRARTRLGRALGVFAPVAAFAVSRLAVPRFVSGQPGVIWPGDVLISVNLLLVLAIGWILYTYLSEDQPEIQPERPDLAPSTG